MNKINSLIYYVIVISLLSISFSSANEFTVNEGSTYNGAVTVGTANYAIGTGSTYGTLTFNSDGTYSYTAHRQPTVGFQNSDNFTYTSNDTSPGDGPHTVSINITPINDAPVAIDSTFTVAEGSNHGGAVSATDVDADSLTYILVSGPSYGTLSFNADGTYSYSAHRQPTDGFNSSDSFTFRANDGLDNSNTATVTVTITPINDLPIANPKSLELNLGETYEGKLEATDLDEDELIFSLVSGSINGNNITINTNGSFIYISNTDFVGQDSFSFNANDGLGDSNTAIVNITVNAFCGGLGTTNDPYLICDAVQLNYVRNNLTAHYKLNNDINLNISPFNTSDGWDPIGDSINPFIGSLDGYDYEINNLFINRSGTNFIGLFGGFEGDVLNLGLINVHVIGNDYVGAFSGQTYQGSINNLYVFGIVEGNNNVGGLTGRSFQSPINNSYTSITVEGSQNIGGLVGNNDVSLINNSYSTGNVIGTSQQVGGLAGQNYGGEIFDSYSSAVVSSNGNRVGGLVGVNTDTGIINSSYATGNVSGIYSVGGLVGLNTGTSTIILSSYATGDVFGEDDYVGGLVGQNTVSHIINSYATGESKGDRDVGGLLGFDTNGIINNSFSIGKVNATVSNGGGLIGSITGTQIISSYYNSETSSQTDTGKGEPKTTAEMKDILTFVNWNISTSTTDLNNGYPFLAWQADVDNFIWLIYEIEEDEEDEEDSDTGGSSSSSSSSSGGSGFVSIINVADARFKEGYSRNLLRGQGLRFNVMNNSHLLMIDEITNSSAKITVSSTPQTNTLNIGDDWKVDVNDDGFYDVLVTLNNISGTRALIEIISINETIPVVFDEVIVEDSDEVEEIESDDVIQEDVDVVDEENFESSSANRNNRWLLWILLISLVVVLVLFYVFPKKKHKKQKH